MKKVQDNYFDNIDTEEKAYLLGFFIADGCITSNANFYENNNRLQVSLKEEDGYIVETFHKLICPDNKITITNYKKGALNRKPVNSIRWTSKYMSEILTNKYNILRNKTYHANFEFPFKEIKEEYIRHFIRGYFDGDGHISYNDITKGFTFAFYGTSKSFLYQIGLLIENLFNVKMIIDCSKKRNVLLYCLRFNSNNKRKEFIIKLSEWFYKDSNIYLIRKKKKFESYLNTVLS
jgi:intein/homing endonuclease